MRSHLSTLSGEQRNLMLLEDAESSLQRAQGKQGVQWSDGVGVLVAVSAGGGSGGFWVLQRGSLQSDGSSVRWVRKQSQ